MKKLLILIVFVPLLSIGQKQGNIWYFGDHAGISFNSGSPVALTDGQTYPCNESEGTSVISDSSGSLLFYSDGQNVWNKNHQIMPNGSGLLGNISSTQSSIIVPKPLSNRFYFVFTTDAFYCGSNLNNGLRYSVIDLCRDKPWGDVMFEYKNILLVTPVCEKLAVARHANGVDYWVLTHKFNSNEFWAFLLTANGITDTVISALGTYHGGNTWTAIGQLKFSHDGNRIAIAAANGLNILELFDFNKSTGIVSNYKSLYKPSNNCVQVYGVEFSPDNSKLYAHGFTCNGIVYPIIFQYNVTAGGGNIDSINASLYIVKNYLNTGPMFIQLEGLQLGPNNKIYLGSNHTFGYLAAINNPDMYGSGCNFQDSAVYLAGRAISYTLPSIIAGYSYSNTTYNCDIATDVPSHVSVQTLSPNPFSHSTRISLSQPYNNIALEVYNLQGQLVAEQHYADCSEITLQRGGLSEGMYFLKLTLDGKMVETKKIVVSD